MPSVNHSERVLVATLGGKPQIVTFALDYLLARGHSIGHVYAVHLAEKDARIQRSLDLLETEIRARYRAPRIQFSRVPVRAHRYDAVKGAPLALGGVVERIDDPEAADANWLTMHRLVSTLKSGGAYIDLCVTGGPRLIGLLAMSAATLLFTPQDHCWHLYTPADVRQQAGDGNFLHAPEPDGSTDNERTHLVAVPLIPLGVLFPNLQSAMYLSPQEIIAQHTRQLSDMEMEHCRSVARQATNAEYRVLRAFARLEGSVSVAAIAAALHVSPNTVRTHNGKVLGYCRNEWELPEKPLLTYHFVREKFGGLPERFWDEADSRHRD